MKLIRSTLAALLCMGSVSSLLASTTVTGPVKTYKFNYTTADAGFSSTYLWVKVALDTPTAASLSIFKFQITTPEGVWSPGQFQPTTGPVSGIPGWASGNVEVTDGGNTLLFLGTPAHLDASAPNGQNYDVQLTTHSVSDTTKIGPSPDPRGSIGDWSPAVHVPEMTSTFGLLLGVLAILGGVQWFHRHSFATKA